MRHVTQRLIMQNYTKITKTPRLTIEIIISIDFDCRDAFPRCVSGRRRRRSDERMRRREGEGRRGERERASDGPWTKFLAPGKKFASTWS